MRTMLIRQSVIALACAELLTSCTAERTGPGAGGRQVSIVNAPFTLTIADLRLPEVRITDATGELLPDADVALTTDHPGIAIVDAAGRLRGVSPGTTTLRATSAGVLATASVTVTSATTYFDLMAYDLRPVPAAIDSGWTNWDGEPWFVVIRVDSGSLRLHGSAPRRYELRLRVMEYRAVTVDGTRTLVPHLAQHFTDVGEVSHDAQGDLLLQSAYIGGYTNRAIPTNAGAAVMFRIPGEDTVIRLDHQRRQ